VKQEVRVQLPSVTLQQRNADVARFRKAPLL
jgi:hypothetical protein